MEEIVVSHSTYINKACTNARTVVREALLCQRLTTGVGDVVVVPFTGDSVGEADGLLKDGDAEGMALGLLVDEGTASMPVGADEGLEDGALVGSGEGLAVGGVVFT